MFQFGANLTDFGFLYIDLFLLTPRLGWGGNIPIIQSIQM